MRVGQRPDGYDIITRGIAFEHLVPDASKVHVVEGVRNEIIDLHQVLVAGQEKSIDELEPILRREFNALKEKDENAPANATIIIRADGDAPTGEVQKIIQMAQKAGFQKFSLRAKEKD